MPVLASTSRVQLRYIPEASFGVIPVTGNPYNLRMTGESLDFALTKNPDKEIRSDRQLVSTTTVNAAASGDVKVHMQYAEYDRLFNGLMMSTWAAFGTNGIGATFTGTMTATTITASAATSGPSIFTNLQAGQWFLLNAPASAADKTLLRVSTSVAPTSTVITLDANTVCPVAAGVTGCTISSSRLTNGTTQQSFTLEKSFNDITQFLTYTGMNVSKFSTAFTSAQLTEGTFSFMGKAMTIQASTLLPGSPVLSQAYNVQNAVTGVGNIWEGGAPLTSSYIKSMTLDIDNTLRMQDAIGSLGAVGIGTGTFACKGTLEVYFTSAAIYNKFLNDTFTSITVSSRDTQGNGYVFTFPKVMLTQAKVQAGAKDLDLLASFSYEAYADTGNATVALQQTLFIDRIGAAVTP